MKRYSLKECARNGESWMMVVPSEQGEWVRYEEVNQIIEWLLHHIRSSSEGLWQSAVEGIEKDWWKDA